VIGRRDLDTLTVVPGQNDNPTGLRNYSSRRSCTTPGPHIGRNIPCSGQLPQLGHLFRGEIHGLNDHTSLRIHEQHHEALIERRYGSWACMMIKWT
jgi:hypothetical protein